MLLIRQKLVPRLLATLGLHHVSDLLVVQIIEAVDASAEFDVRDGFDIEDENWHGGLAGDR